MGHSYKAIGWNAQKRAYDLALAGATVAYLTLFLGLGFAWYPSATAETLLIRAFGSAALILLHVVLCIGPLCRLSDSFLPLLYNRRHLGVGLFLVASVHVVLVTVQFHALGSLNPLASILSGGGLERPSFNFQLLGLLAFTILLLMAATSHDFWLRNLSAPVWKAFHMMVYVAYLLLIGHVAFGLLHQEQRLLWFLPLLSGTLLVGGLHAAAAWREHRRDKAHSGPTDVDGFQSVCRVDELEESRGRTFLVGGERVAVFRHDGKISAVSNLCQHQNGPLGEGRIVDGCIVCPWHGYQYDPANGCSPPPFTEKVPTYRVRLAGPTVQIHETPLPAGTPTEPAVIPR